MTFHGGILNDEEVKTLILTKHLLEPFILHQEGKPSYGLGSFGYDIRLGNKFLVPTGGINMVLDPLAFPREYFQLIEKEDIIELAPGSQVLAESIERFTMPDDVFGICYGKSTYSRCGLLVNVTPLEPNWEGILTLELANLSPLPIRLHIGKGIAQIVFFRGNRPRRTYSEKESGGVYQHQSGVTLPK